MEPPVSPAVQWVAIAGKWRFESGRATYLGPQETQPSEVQFGVSLANARLRSGKISAAVAFPAGLVGNAGRIIFGYNAGSRAYLSGGIGGYGFEYVLDEFIETRGWHALSATGNALNSQMANGEYSMIISIRGQRVSVFANGVQVVDHDLGRPLYGDQVGLFAWGPGPVEFHDLLVTPRMPTAFVVMQYGDPYESLYAEVIKPVTKDKGLDVYRVDEVYRPGIILQDITAGIIEAEVVIAEITPPNPNVFYELGYAHAVGKPTILLAERGKELPFDIKGFRCIFYEDTIKGKKEVEINLKRHLSSILHLS